MSENPSNSRLHRDHEALVVSCVENSCLRTPIHPPYLAAHVASALNRTLMGVLSLACGGDMTGTDFIARVRLPLRLSRPGLSIGQTSPKPAGTSAD